MAHADLREPRFPRQFGRPLFMGGKPIAMHKGNRHRPQPGSPSRLQIGQQALFIQWDQDLAIRRTALIHLDHMGIKRRGAANIQIKQMRPILLADPQSIAKTAGDEQRNRLALALKQGIGGHRGAHADAGNFGFRKRRIIRHRHQTPHPGHRRIIIMIGII
ncbi:hypothetical protein AQ1_01976 [alpha proteobacterium Q-1]|nr:hypothetical protein AQ1_01976 [alpha proteobacterium Q-1]